jgi:anti-sigma B factor antagonist
MDLSISVSSLNGLAWVTLEGELDMDGAQRLEHQLSQFDLATTDVRLDLTAVSFIDSTGLSVLLGLAHRAHEHGRRIALVRPAPAISRLLHLVDVAQRFDVVDPQPESAEARART